MKVRCNIFKRTKFWRGINRGKQNNDIWNESQDHPTITEGTEMPSTSPHHLITNDLLTHTANSSSITPIPPSHLPLRKPAFGLP